MEQELTLHTLKPLLLQSDAENCSDALFLKKLFYHIVDESVIQKKLICKDFLPFFCAWRLVILNAKEQTPRRTTGASSIAFIFLP